MKGRGRGNSLNTPILGEEVLTFYHLIHFLRKALGFLDDIKIKEII